jgi:chemotaxis protein MotB
LSPTGQQEIGKLAGAMQELIREIPEDLNWVLQVDGHTDSDPINTPQFPSNWVLSSARAIAVVEALAAQGIPSEHLVAAGFGEFQPLDPGVSEDAKTRNRRIELKLTTHE